MRSAKVTANAFSAGFHRMVHRACPVPLGSMPRVTKVTATRGATYTELTLEAIDGTHQRLGTLLGQAGIPTHPESLFAGPAPRKRQRHSEPQVQVSLRLTMGQRDVTDRLAGEHSATSRSALVTAALRGHLG